MKKKLLSQHITSLTQKTQKITRCVANTLSRTSLPIPLLQSPTADVRHKIMDKLVSGNPQDSLPRFIGELLSDSTLEDVNRALTTILTIIIIQTNQWCTLQLL